MSQVLLADFAALAAAFFFSRIKLLQLLLHIDTNAWVKEAEHGDDVTYGEGFSATVWCNFHNFGDAAFMIHKHCEACTAKHLFELDMWENKCFTIFSLGHLWNDVSVQW